MNSTRIPMAGQTPPIAPTAADLAKWRTLEALQVLRILADYVKEDDTFKPTKATKTKRVHVNAAGGDWELLVAGPKFYDTRASTGGGGAIDLVMHIWRVPFKQALIILREAEPSSRRPQANGTT